MKSKTLFTLLVCCLFGAKLSAQCTANINYQQSVDSTFITFSTDSTSGPAPMYMWTFGDGTGGNGSSVSHQYTATGSAYYYVCLTKTDTILGCTYTICDSVHVGMGNCSASISYTTQDSLYTFTAIPTGTAPFSYSWTNQGTGTSAGSGSTAAIVIPNAYTQVCLTITDSTGCTSSACVAVFDSIYGPNCTSYIGYTNQDSLFSFTVTHTGSAPVSYAWSVNGVPAGTSANEVLVLDQTIYSVICVSVTDASGCISSYCQSILSDTTVGGGGGCNTSVLYTMQDSLYTFIVTTGGVAPYS